MERAGTASLSPISRRRLLQSGLAAAGSLALAARSRTVIAHPRFGADPFTLGVASGYPRRDGFVLWTRLAPQPLAPDGGMPPTAVEVTWEVASDERFRRIVRRGRVLAAPEWAHSVHVEPAGLEPGRPWWYRFSAGDARSPAGRTWTATAAGVSPPRLRLAVASCQHYEHGYYAAYRRMLDDAVDLVVHVGDYIYEIGGGPRPMRSHEAGECMTLADYRIRHALYRSDPDLAAAHAACPWLLTWDDHEVDNDYAGTSSQDGADPVRFLARRAAAYQAYYEHLPLPRTARPVRGGMRLHHAASFGDLLTLCMLDQRQHRSRQACAAPGRAGAARVSPQGCAELSDPDRTMLGAQQERWLGETLRGSAARWHLLAQGVVMSYANEAPPPEQRFWTDAWNGYPAARSRLLGQLADSRAANPVFLSGDIHAFVAGDLHRDPADPASARVASELVTTSVSSGPPPAEVLERYRRYNPALLVVDGERRGYLRLDVTPRTLHAALVGLDDARERDSAARVLASFVLESGGSGLQRA